MVGKGINISVYLGKTNDKGGNHRNNRVRVLTCYTLSTNHIFLVVVIVTVLAGTVMSCVTLRVSNITIIHCGT